MNCFCRSNWNCTAARANELTCFKELSNGYVKMINAIAKRLCKNEEWDFEIIDKEFCSMYIRCAVIEDSFTFFKTHKKLLIHKYLTLSCCSEEESYENLEFEIHNKTMIKIIAGPHIKSLLDKVKNVEYISLVLDDTMYDVTLTPNVKILKIARLEQYDLNTVGAFVKYTHRHKKERYPKEIGQFDIGFLNLDIDNYNDDNEVGYTESLDDATMKKILVNYRSIKILKIIGPYAENSDFIYRININEILEKSVEVIVLSSSYTTSIDHTFILTVNRSALNDSLLRSVQVLYESEYRFEIIDDIPGTETAEEIMNNKHQYMLNERFSRVKPVSKRRFIPEDVPEEREVKRAKFN